MAEKLSNIIKMYDTKNTYNRRVTTGFYLPHSLLNELDARRSDSDYQSKKSSRGSLKRTTTTQADILYHAGKSQNAISKETTTDQIKGFDKKQNYQMILNLRFIFYI
jgi:hypothetical protein